jgi:hypothetical protein
VPLWSTLYHEATPAAGLQIAEEPLVSHVPAKKLYNIAVVGATGLVGQQFLRILAKRHFPLRHLKLCASRRSVGKRIQFGDSDIEVQEATPKALAGADIVFISATDEVSRQLPPLITKNGAVVIDDSGVWRMEPNVPRVIPEVNPDDVTQHEGVLAIPNCSTTPVVMCLWALHRVNPVKRVIAATYQSVSGTGQAAVHELTEQTRRVLENQRATPHVYPHQIAHNLLPEIGSFKDELHQRGVEDGGGDAQDHARAGPRLLRDLRARPRLHRSRGRGLGRVEQADGSGGGVRAPARLPRRRRTGRHIDKPLPSALDGRRPR